ncbi:MAG: protein kinase, partial [Anaerolineae bacterium]|nr:protein kinase [Anaerolineae bacterium]
MATDDLSGQVIRGYELRDKLGVGGFGAVYSAYQPAVGREVAIKIILPSYANHPDFIRRFEVEAQLVARLEHPYIVPLYDFWREPSGAYLVMRKLGSNLRAYLNEYGPFDLRRTVRFLDQIAAALTVAHRNGVVHRDLKPDNILLDADGNAYLSDFSIAKDLGSKANLTQDGTMLGSPAYLSPEQIRAEPITTRSDLYTLGIVLFEMLAGSHPYDAATTPHSLIYKHIQDPLPSLEASRPDLPPELDEVLAQATAKLPEERFPDALSLAAAFRRVAQLATDDGPVPRRASGAVKTTRFTTTLPRIEVENPYKGLRAFQEADSPDFFGREALTEGLLARLSEEHELARFLALVGPSGSGKSSVVHAGLVPALRQGALPGSDDWFYAEMVPGAHPLEELEIALLRVAVGQPPGLMEQLRRDERGLARAARLILPEDDELLLIIDHFEEVFTLAADADEVRQFMDVLHYAVTDARSHVRLIVMLRADFYDRPLMIPNFSSLMRQRTEVIVPLTPDELERAIVGPAVRVGALLEPGLAAAIVAELNEQPGALPMLQYALTELFDRREANVLTLAAYHAIGGTLGALARRADEVYAALSEPQQEAARQLFLRLVTLGEGTGDTRRRVLRSSVLRMSADEETMRAVIRNFGTSRLLTFDHDPATREPTLEVAHEALIREWGQLREWLADSRDDLRMEQRLTAAAREWQLASRERSFLATGSRLAGFEAWAAQTDLKLNEQAAAYLQASIAEREAREAAEAARQAREAMLERRSRGRLRALVIVLAIGLLLTVGLALIAINNQQYAEAQAEIARQNAEESYSLALASNARQALRENNGEVAVILALEAARTPSPLPQVVRALAEVLYTPGTRHLLTGHTDGVRAVAYSPDGTRAISGSIDFTLILWDVATG